MNQTMSGTAAAPNPWALSIQVFFYLQLLDVLTTWVGFRIGLVELSPFIQFLMKMGPLVGLLGSKIVACGLAGFCIWRRRLNVIRLINYWYAGLIVWNLAIILSR